MHVRRAGPTRRPWMWLLCFSCPTSAQTTTCPKGWIASTTNACYKLSDRAASHIRCVELCGANASLACIGSAEENEFVSFMARGGLSRSGATHVWIGHYQLPNSTEPDGGWGRCSSGEASNFTNWMDGQPDNLGVSRTVGENCARLTTSGAGRWQDEACIEEYRCLCELGAVGQKPSPDYVSFVESDIEAMATGCEDF